MGLIPRRFLNLLVNEHVPGVKSLRFIDLKRQRLFYPDTPPPPSPSASSTTIRLPKPSFTFRPADSDASDEWRIHCFPLVGRRVVCADQSGRAFAVDADARVARTMPSIKPKRMPLSLSIPRPAADDHGGNTGSSLFVMERFPKYSDRFEALVNRHHTLMSSYMAWHCDELPLPPFVRKNSKDRHEITACAVVGGGGISDICISAEGAGTYRMPWLETARHEWVQVVASREWVQVGDWTLPFCGKAEFVPELNLWFGLSADDAKALAAADLSAMDSRPQLVGPWKELDDDGVAPDEECQDAQLVNLGSGRFCVARFFGPAAATDGDSDSSGDGLAADKSFVVLTGVEVVRHAAGGDGNGSGEMELQMMKHRSRRLNNTDGATIEAVF